MFKKILVANRGEIAVRILRSCRRLGVATVAVHGRDEEGALHLRHADEALALDDEGETPVYGKVEALVDACRRSGAEALHPGYGFLAERPELARAVEGAGLTFVGPRPETLEILGDKLAANRAAVGAGVPVLEQSRALTDLDSIRREATELGFPLLVKSPLGGGGLGCHRADGVDALEEAWRTASSQGLNLYGSATVFLERFVQGRHVEVQLLGDGRGKVVVLGDRECSIQRRRQKVVEEAPAQNLSAPLRKELHEAARRLGASLRLRNAATVEFLVEGESFWFLEVNPRIQVEHPVTEEVFAIDLVAEQLGIAAGGPLLLEDGLKPRGYAVEFRVYAETPEDDRPAPGRIDWLRLPTGPGIRVDEGIEEGMEVGRRYDPLLAKLVCHGRDKTEALARAREALRSFACNGSLQCNLPLLRAIATAPWFATGDYDTCTLETRRPAIGESPFAALLPGLLARLEERRSVAREGKGPEGSRWRGMGWRQLP